MTKEEFESDQQRLRDLAAANPTEPLVSNRNGVLVECSPEEVAAIKADWAAADAASAAEAAKPRPMAADDVLAILKRKGVVTDADIAAQRPALRQRGTP